MHNVAHSTYLSTIYTVTWLALIIVRVSPNGQTEIRTLGRCIDNKKNDSTIIWP
jgi:hypothetical protein